jgi:hypothetical protein
LQLPFGQRLSEYPFQRPANQSIPGTGRCGWPNLRRGDARPQAR